MSDKREPCGNDACDRCYPQPTWRIRQHRVQHISHERDIKAATADEALAAFRTGTSWPSSYDYSYGEIVQQDDPVVEQLPFDEYGQDCCYHDLEDKVAAMKKAAL